MTTISFSSGSSVVPVPPVRAVRETVPPVPDPAPPLAAMPSSGALQSMQPPLSGALTWKVKSSDPLTSLMTVNYGSKPLLKRFDGLGAAALNRFATDATDFSQAVSQPDAAPQTAYQVALTIKMADDVSVQVNLESKGNSLSLQITSSNKPGAADRAALARLAEGFQAAVDGMGGSSQPDFSGLLDYDTALVSSIDLQATVKTSGTAVQTQTLHADQARRTFSADGPDGHVNISVDLRRDIAGTAQQRQAGLDAYLKQFEEAGARGHANAGTLATFSAAFQQLTYQPSHAVATSIRPISLSDEDHAMLSGLPDFSASMSDTPVSSNPMRPGEVDTFSYQVSQVTTLGGIDQADRSISQKRHAHLEASFHEPLSASQPLKLDDTRASQNYYFKHVSEDRSSDTRISYHDGRMISAVTSEDVTSSTQVLKYVMGILTEDTTTPSETHARRDLLKQPRPG